MSGVPDGVSPMRSPRLASYSMIGNVPGRSSGSPPVSTTRGRPKRRISSSRLMVASRVVSSLG